MSPRLLQTTFPGYTLIEVLLSTTLGVGLILLLANATISTAEHNKRLTDELDRSARARLVLDLLANDLQSIIQRRDANIWFAVDVLSDTKNTSHWQSAAGQKPATNSLALHPGFDAASGMINPEDYRFGMAGIWLRLITTAEDRSIFSNGKTVPGDVNAVAYQLIRRPLPSLPSISDGSNAGYQMHRSVVRADATFDEGYAIDAYQGASDLGKPGEIKSPRLDSVVCNQVIDFGIIIYQINENGDLVQGFPERDSSLPPLANPLQYRAPRDGMPARLEALVRIVSIHGAQQLQQQEQSPFSADEWWKLVRKESRVYSRTLTLPQAL
ncbi:MAG: hypothetical protein RL693_568 [Verrucomicrobiota bacterium]|jgi:hypothetical protein